MNDLDTDGPFVNERADDEFDEVFEDNELAEDVDVDETVGEEELGLNLEDAVNGLEDMEDKLGHFGYAQESAEVHVVSPPPTSDLTLSLTDSQGSSH